MPHNRPVHCALWVLVVLLAGLLVPGEAMAQRFGGREFGRGRGPGGPGGSSLTGMLRSEEVQQQLQLTDAQKSSLEELNVDSRSNPAFGEMFERMRSAETDEEREKLRTEFQQLRETQQAAAEKKLREVLSAEQMRQLVERYLREEGPTALSQQDVARAVGLTEAQQKQIQELNEKRQEEIREQFRGPRDENLSREDREKQREESRQQWNTKLLAVLGETQLATWQKLSVEGSEGSGSSATTNSTGSAPAEKPAPALADPSQFGSQSEEPAGDPVASFGASAGPRTAAGTPSVAEPAAAGPPAPREGTMSFNFRQAPWADVLRLFAETAGLTLDLNAVPTGTFTYYDSSSYTPEEALDVLNGYLLPRGFLLVRRDRFLTAVSIENGVPPNLVPSVSLEELNNRGDHELLSIVLPLQGGEAEKAAAEVEKLLGPQGKVAALATSNALSVTDVGRNLRQIVRLFGGEGVADPDTVVFRAFPLRNVPAADAEKIVKTMLGIATTVPNVSAASDRSSRYRSYRSRFGSRGGDSDSSSQSSSSSSSSSSTSKAAVAIDRRSNSLLVTATNRQMAIVESVIESLDGRGDGRGFAITEPLDTEPRLKVYSVTSADAREVTKTINALLPGLVVNEDGRAKRIHIFATPAEHIEIERLIRQLDGDAAGGAREVAVLPLSQLDPIGAAGTLRSLFMADGEQAPVVEADVLGRRLIVRGSAEQLTQVRSLLTQLGEDGRGPAYGSGRAYGSGPVRTLNLDGRDPEEFLRLLDRAWTASSGQSLRVVRPEAPPAIDRQIIPGEGELNGVENPRRLDRQPGEGTDDPAYRSAADRELNQRENPATGSFRPNQSDSTPGQGSPEAAPDLPLRGSLRMRTPQTPSFRRSSTEDYRTERTVPRQPDDQSARAGQRTEEKTATDRTGSQSDEELFAISATAAADDSEADNEDDTAAEAAAAATDSTVQPEVAPGKESTVELSNPQSAETSPASSKSVPATPEVRNNRAESESESESEATAAGQQESPAVTQQPAADAPPVSRQPEGSSAPQPPPARSTGPAVSVTVVGDQLVISSTDEASLDRLESLVDTLGRAMPVQTTWSVFYLKAADATETAAMLEQLFPTSSVSLTNSAADTGLMGSLTGGISSLGRSVAGMTGLSSLGGGMQTLRIIPEVRANALFVSGPPLLVRQVGDTLKILDAAELPESYRDRVPRFIPVRYADVNEVATIVKEVYKDYMEDANSAGGRDDRRMRAFAAMMGGGGGNQGNQQRQQPAIRLTLGVDLQTSQLIVSSSEAIYQQVASLVETLDQSAEDARRTVRVIPLENSESVMVQQALGQLIPKVRISGTIRQNTSTTTSTSSTGNRSGSTSSDEERRERFRQFFQQRMQQGGGGGDRGRATSGGSRSRSTGSTRGGSYRGGSGGGGRSGGGRGSRGRN